MFSMTASMWTVASSCLTYCVRSNSLPLLVITIVVISLYWYFVPPQLHKQPNSHKTHYWPSIYNPKVTKSWLAHSMSCSCCQVSWVTMLIIWFWFIWRTLHNIHWLHCSHTFYCPVDCCCCWDSILWLRFTTTLCRTVAAAKHYERWSRCYAPELLNSSDLHFMIANITESLPLQINLGQPPGPLTQGIVMTSDWSSQSTICLLIGQ